MKSCIDVWYPIDSKQNRLKWQLVIWAENNIEVDGNRWIGAQHEASSRTFIGVQKGKTYSGHENDSRRMNFGAMELNAMIHDLEQQEMANQTRGPVRDGYKRPFHCIRIRKWAAQRRAGISGIYQENINALKTPITLITFYSYLHSVSAKLSARQNPVGHSRTRLCPWTRPKYLNYI